MAITKKLARTAAPSKRAAQGLEGLIENLGADAQQAIARNGAEIRKAVQGLRVEVERRAERIVRDAERKILKQMHAATEEQVQRLEKRVALLERRAHR
jgi:hypothetical protein